MPTPRINRRVVFHSLVGMTMLAARPASAGYRPTIDEIAHDPEIPALGNQQGDVTIVEFFDYLCPACRVAYSDLKDLQSEDGNLRVVLKDWPIFGNASREAARLALAAQGQGKYAEAVDALMTFRERLSRSRIEAILEDAGVDIDELRLGLSMNEQFIDSILTRNDMQARAFDLPGTPGFVIGATLYRRYMDRSALQQAVLTTRSVLNAGSDAH